jgi:hypothetical protein
MPTHDAIRRYLADLETALRGADPALVHDALIDAQSHLAEAIINGVAVEDAIRDFGEPAEIAKAYIDAEAAVQVRRTPLVRTVAVDSAPDAGSAKRPLSKIPVIGIWFDRYAWGSYALLTFGAVISALVGLWAHGLLVLGVGTAPLFVGIPCFILLLASVRGISLFLGKIIETLVGVRMPHRAQPVDLSGAVGFFRRIGVWFTDLRSWLTLAFILANFWVTIPLALFVGIFSLFGSCLILGGLGIGDIALQGTNAEHLTGLFGGAFGHLFAVIFGFLLLTTILWFSKGIAFGYAHLVKAIQIARPTAK